MRNMGGKSKFRTYHRGESIVFLKTKDQWGGLSNMSAGFPIRVNGVDIRTSESLYQACRFPTRPDVQQMIIDQASPMAAKMKGKPFRRTDNRSDWDKVQISIMRWALRVKLAQNWDKFGSLLRDTGNLPIVEESRRDQFWGAKPIDYDTLLGQNILGRLLMELREDLLGETADALSTVEPLEIPDFVLLGEPITAIRRQEPKIQATSVDDQHEAQPTTVQSVLTLDTGRNSKHPHSDQKESPSMNSTTKRKLIEVALPLDAINKESAREKSIRHGHPSTLHLWWARRPLAACRAVLFASLVDDPSSHPDRFPTEVEQDRERDRLFRIIEEMVKWENTTNETVLNAARDEILRSTNDNPPPVLDPFCGGGSIPLEAQRLGLEAHGSDLNPVAVLITKALIEIPPKFAGKPPVSKKSNSAIGGSAAWKGAAGLAEDVRHYGQWMRDEAEKRIGHLYPTVTLPAGQGGGQATVIAWLWARTVTCPNPACGAEMLLVRSFWLSKKKNRQAWVEPIIDRQAKTVRFEVKTGNGEPPDGTVNRRGATCIVCETPAKFPYIREQGRAGHMSRKLMAIVADGSSGRVYVTPDNYHVQVAESETPEWRPENTLPDNPRDFKTPNYGMLTFGDLFTDRQLVALTTFSDLVGEARQRVQADAIATGLPDDGRSLADGGTGATAYADAVATYLAFGVDRSTNYWSSLTPWGGDFIVQTFGRQALPMVWDYAEANPFSASTGNWSGAIDWITKCLNLSIPANNPGYANQADASKLEIDTSSFVIATDPPYYDNIGYADLADFFYVWLRKSLLNVFPNLLATLLTPKSNELIATPYRNNGDKHKAEKFFENGLHQAFTSFRKIQNQDFPLPIFYAFKQAETKNSGQLASTGWETMLESLISSSFMINGTWPVRSERSQGLKSGTNVLASSIVLVCRPRPEDAPITSERNFIGELRRELPTALRTLQHGNIAPVDLAQASIGPGMAIYSRYSRVVTAGGERMPVRRALELINQLLDEVLREEHGDLDADTRWALAWFEEYGLRSEAFGRAETLSRAFNTSVDGLRDAGILESRRGEVRLLRRDELGGDWDPAGDSRLPTWEATQRLILALETEGEPGAADLLRQLGPAQGETVRDLAYRLYSICERKNRAEEALSYNGLVTSWPEIQRLAADSAIPVEGQTRLEV